MGVFFREKEVICKLDLFIVQIYGILLASKLISMNNISLLRISIFSLLFLMILIIFYTNNYKSKLLKPKNILVKYPIRRKKSLINKSIRLKLLVL